MCFNKQLVHTLQVKVACDGITALVNRGDMVVSKGIHAIRTCLPGSAKGEEGSFHQMFPEFQGSSSPSEL